MRETARMLLTAVLLCVGASADAQQRQQARDEEPMIVFAAASLAEVMQKIGASFTNATRIPLRYSFAASSALAKQIEQGAGAAVFMSADEDWMDYLASRSLIDPTSRYDLVTNRLALIAPSVSTIELRIAPSFPLAAALGPDGHLATGDPDSVPVGKYAKAALTALQVWSQVEPRLVRTENVRIALQYVARGEAPLGIVYVTDAKIEPKVRVVAVFPESLHERITYPVAATKPASARAHAFVDYLKGAEADRIFREAGFVPRADD